MKKHLWLIFIIVGLLLFYCGMQTMVHAQTIAGSGLTIAAPGTPPTPPQGSTVRITGIGAENGPLFSDAEGDILKRALLKTDLPPGIAWLADDQVFTGANTFTDTIVAPAIRAPIGSFTIRNSTDTAWVVMVLDTSITMRYVTDFGANIRVTTSAAIGTSATVGTTLGVTGLSTLTGGYNSGANSSITGNLTFNGMSRRITGEMSGTPTERLTFQTSAAAGGQTHLQLIPKSLTGDASGSSVIVFNREDVANPGTAYGFLGINTDAVVLSTGTIGGLDTLPMQFQHQGVNKAEMTAAGWRFYDKVGLTGLYSMTDPFTIYATDTVTPLMHLFDAGRNVVRNTGQNTYWEYQAHGNAVDEKLWRAGVIGGQYRVDAGNDAGNTWGNLFRSTMSAAVPNGLYWGDAVKNVNPNKNYMTNLGQINQKYLQLHAAELWVETLVAQDTIGTIGGRVLVGPTTILQMVPGSVDGGASWYITTKHNNLFANDIVYMEAGGQVEFWKVLGSAGTCETPGACAPGITGYIYQMQRDLEGNGAPPREWIEGDAIFNTGQPGNGFIDIYSLRGMRPGASENGPTIVGNVRTGYGYNEWGPRWAIGNLAGIYEQGAAQTWGSAFGDVNAVHMIIDSTYGLRGKLGIDQKFVIQPNGIIILGDTGGGRANTYLDSTHMQMRLGTVPRTLINADGVYNYDPTGVLRSYLNMEGLYVYNQSGTQIIANIGHNSSRFGYALAYHNSIYLEQSTGRMIFYSANTAGTQVPRIIFDAANANISFYDTGGGYPHLVLGAFGANFGYTHGAFGNIHINTTGQLYMRAGGTVRMLLDANGAMTWYDPSSIARQQIRSDQAQFGGVDAGARIVMAAGNLSMYDNANKKWYEITPGIVYMGDWYNVGGTYLQTSPTYLQFCNAGYSCPLVFYGTSGNINSAGNILLTGGGNVTSSGNFTLGATSGLRFEVYSAAQYEANRAIQWFKAGVLYADMGMGNEGSILLHSRTWGGGTGIRLAVGTAEHLVGGLRPGVFLTHEQAGSYHMTNFVLQGISANGNYTMTQFIPLHGSNSPGVNNVLGGTWAGTSWNTIYGQTYVSSGYAGFTGPTQVRKWDNSGYCTYNFYGGIMVSTDCKNY